MNTLTKQDVEKVVEKLADKMQGWDGLLTRPILIGDVLEKILQADDDCGGLEAEEDVKECTALWYDCGLTKSLQEIAGRIGWEDGDCGKCEPKCSMNMSCPANGTRAKPSPEVDLLLFIHNLGL